MIRVKQADILETARVSNIVAQDANISASGPVVVAQIQSTMRLIPRYGGDTEAGYAACGYPYIRSWDNPSDPTMDIEPYIRSYGAHLLPNPSEPRVEHVLDAKDIAAIDRVLYGLVMSGYRASSREWEDCIQVNRGPVMTEIVCTDGKMLSSATLATRPGSAVGRFVIPKQNYRRVMRHRPDDAVGGVTVWVASELFLVSWPHIERTPVIESPPLCFDYLNGHLRDDPAWRTRASYGVSITELQRRIKAMGKMNSHATFRCGKKLTICGSAPMGFGDGDGTVLCFDAEYLKAFLNKRKPGHINMTFMVKMPDRGSASAFTEELVVLEPMGGLFDSTIGREHAILMSIRCGVH